MYDMSILSDGKICLGDRLMMNARGSWFLNSIRFRGRRMRAKRVDLAELRSCLRELCFVLKSLLNFAKISPSFGYNAQKSSRSNLICAIVNMKPFRLVIIMN